ncbi:MAG: alpha/beta fold hydrolase [Phenylobacterium sp.]
MTRLGLALLALLSFFGLAGPVNAAEPPSVARVGAIQDRFDPLGPPVQALTLPNGRTVHYADTGEVGWRPVLFVGGTGTSARAFLMTEFLQTLRRQLKLRLISVERNGFGDTAFVPGWTYGDYAQEVRAVLDRLGVSRFAGLAISGGGPYLAQVAAAMPERLISVHMMAAATQRPADDPICKTPAAALAGAVKSSVQNPRVWWAFPPNSPTGSIPGFADTAYDEGARAFFIRGQMGDPAPQVAELQRYCGPLADLAAVKAPAFIYQGTADPLVTVQSAEYWRAHLPNVARSRTYPGEGHDIQYRHWDQALLDISGHPDLTMLCVKGRSQAVPEAAAEPLLKAGATLGVCAWRM